MDEPVEQVPVGGKLTVEVGLDGVIGARPERPRRHDAAVDDVVHRLVGRHLDADRLAVAVRLRVEPGPGDDPRRRRPTGGDRLRVGVRPAEALDLEDAAVGGRPRVGRRRRSRLEQRRQRRPDRPGAGRADDRPPRRLVYRRLSPIVLRHRLQHPECGFQSSYEASVCNCFTTDPTGYANG